MCGTKTFVEFRTLVVGIQYACECGAYGISVSNIFPSTNKSDFIVTVFRVPKTLCDTLPTSNCIGAVKTGEDW